MNDISFFENPTQSSPGHGVEHKYDNRVNCVQQQVAPCKEEIFEWPEVTFGGDLWDVDKGQILQFKHDTNYDALKIVHFSIEFRYGNVPGIAC